MRGYMLGESVEAPWQKEQGPKVRVKDWGTEMKDDERNRNIRTSKDKNIQYRHQKKTKLLKPAAHPQNSVQESFQGFTILLTASGHEHFRGWRAVRFCEALTYDLLPFQSQLGSSSKLIPTWCHRCWVWCRQAQLDRIKRHEKTLCSSLIRKSWQWQELSREVPFNWHKELGGAINMHHQPSQKNGRHIWQCLAGHQKKIMNAKAVPRWWNIEESPRKLRRCASQLPPGHFTKLTWAGSRENTSL